MTMECLSGLRFWIIYWIPDEKMSWFQIPGDITDLFLFSNPGSLRKNADVLAVMVRSLLFPPQHLPERYHACNGPRSPLRIGIIVSELWKSGFSILSRYSVRERIEIKYRRIACPLFLIKKMISIFSIRIMVHPATKYPGAGTVRWDAGIYWEYLCGRDMAKMYPERWLISHEIIFRSSLSDCARAVNLYSSSRHEHRQKLPRECPGNFSCQRLLSDDHLISKSAECVFPGTAYLFLPVPCH